MLIFSVIKRIISFFINEFSEWSPNPLSFIFIRYLVQSNLSADEAGVWSSIVRISVFYMTFVSSICNLYFYPKLSKKKYFQNIKPLLQNITENLFLLCFRFAIVFCTSKSCNFTYLYRRFFNIKRLFLFTTYCRFCKIIKFNFGYLLIAKKKKIWQFILFEIISLGSYCLGSYIFIKYLKLDGVYYSLIGSLIIYLQLHT